MKRLTAEDQMGVVLHQGAGGGAGVWVADRITLRRPMPSDRDGLTAMLERCSLNSRYGRFLGPLRRFPAGHLEAVTVPCLGVEARIAVVGDGDDGVGDVVALASMHQQGAGEAELAVLVEDAWQRHGLGTELLLYLAEQARGRGITTLHAAVLSEHTHVLRLLYTVFGPIHLQQETGTTNVTIPLCDPSIHAVVPSGRGGGGHDDVGQIAAPAVVELAAAGHQP